MHLGAKPGLWKRKRQNRNKVINILLVFIGLWLVFYPQLSSSAKLPVIVFVHGGAYVGGSAATALYGPELYLDKDVVLVTLNYRLGIMGK